MKNQSQNKIDEIAIAHDYLTQRGGAERVVLAMHKAFPEAKIYTTLYDPENTYPEFKNANIVVSPLNKLSIFRKNHRLALPILPVVCSLFRVPAQKTLVSSTGWAHGFKFSGKSFIYCHSPARWLYLSDQYLGDMTSSPVGTALKILRPALTAWDQWSAQKAGTYVGNSTVIQERIKNVYGREVKVLFPPHTVSVEGQQQQIPKLATFFEKPYFLVVSRLLPYKNVDKLVQAFNEMPNQQLLIIGDGPSKAQLKGKAKKNIKFASRISDEEMRYAYAHCTALLAVSYEDFGLTPLEAGGFGKPTIALKAGGYLDTIQEGLNGTFIEKSTADNVKKAVKSFEASKYSEELIKQHMQQFSEERFIQTIKECIEKL